MLRQYDDDDGDDDCGCRNDKVLVAVAVAGLTALATKLVDWAVDELRAKYGKAKPSPEDKSE